jgi:hypothetical protein
MGYKECLELAGAKVIGYKEFGSWQGEWIAYVEYKGQRGFVRDYYGSCSGCDAYQSEFNIEPHNCNGREYYSPFYEGYKENCELCQKEKLKEIKFGESYLEDILSYDEILEIASRNLTWDESSTEMADFVKEVIIIKN